MGFRRYLLLSIPESKHMSSTTGHSNYLKHYIQGNTNPGENPITGGPLLYNGMYLVVIALRYWYAAPGTTYRADESACLVSAIR